MNEILTHKKIMENQIFSMISKFIWLYKGF